MTNRGQDARGATSNSSSDPWHVAGRKRDKFYGAPPDSPGTHDLHDHPSYGSRDDENRRLVLVHLPGAAVPPPLTWVQK